MFKRTHVSQGYHQVLKSDLEWYLNHGSIMDLYHQVLAALHFFLQINCLRKGTSDG